MKTKSILVLIILYVALLTRNGSAPTTYIITDLISPIVGYVYHVNTKGQIALDRQTSFGGHNLNAPITFCSFLYEDDVKICGRSIL